MNCERCGSPIAIQMKGSENDGIYHVDDGTDANDLCVRSIPAPPDAGELAKRLRAHAMRDECSVRSWGEEPTDIAGDLEDAADELDRLATVEAERGEYLTQARIAEQMRQTATVERDAAYARQTEAWEKFEAERARAVRAESDAENGVTAFRVVADQLAEARIARHLAEAVEESVADLQQIGRLMDTVARKEVENRAEHAEAEELAAKLRASEAEVARLAKGHDEYGRVNQLLTEENDRLRAIADAAWEYVAARAERTVAPPVTRVDARRHIKRTCAALVAAVEAKS